MYVIEIYHWPHSHEIAHEIYIGLCQLSNNTVLIMIEDYLCVIKSYGKHISAMA